MPRANRNTTPARAVPYAVPQVPQDPLPNIHIILPPNPEVIRIQQQLNEHETVHTQNIINHHNQLQGLWQCSLSMAH